MTSGQTGIPRQWKPNPTKVVVRTTVHSLYPASLAQPVIDCKQSQFQAGGRAGAEDRPQRRRHAEQYRHRSGARRHRRGAVPVPLESLVRRSECARIARESGSDPRPARPLRRGDSASRKGPRGWFRIARSAPRAGPLTGRKGAIGRRDSAVRGGFQEWRSAYSLGALLYLKRAWAAWRMPSDCQRRAWQWPPSRYDWDWIQAFNSSIALYEKAAAAPRK